MELLYVVELDVQSAEAANKDGFSARQAVIGHIGRWISPSEGAINFEEAGEILIPGLGGQAPDKRVKWSVDGDDQINGLFVSVRTAIGSYGRSDFVCNADLVSDSAATVLRVELARQSVDGSLVPADVDYFRRPGILSRIATDSSLKSRTGPSLVDARFDWVQEEHVEFVWESLSSKTRLLPVLLVDGSTEAGRKLAKRAASELVGLSLVLAFSRAARENLNSRLRDVEGSIPLGGARLVWPDLGSRHPIFPSTDISRADTYLFQMLSALSVTARGVNRLRKRVSDSRRSSRGAQLAVELENAKALGGLSDQVEAQAKVIDKLERDCEELVEWMGQLEQQRDEAQAQASQAGFWKQEAERLRRSSASSTQNWSGAPDLDSNSLDELANYLETASLGSIIFTRAARQSWKNADFPRVADMGAALVSLAQAAVEYRELNCKLGMLSDDWFKTGWELNFAATDKGLSRHGGDQFTFEGAEYSRLPHLKLGDHTSPNEVGRIYFAMDKDGKRFIVDHVGLKLYGL